MPWNRVRSQLVEQYMNQWSWFDEWLTGTGAPIDRRAGQLYKFSHFRTPSWLLDSASLVSASVADSGVKVFAENICGFAPWF